MQIYTIGHSTHTIEEFTQMLNNNNIELLVDIRSFPGSRRYPHFNKEAMPIWLHESGIEYMHLPKLGGRRRKIKDVDYHLVNAWENVSFSNYAAYTLTDEFKEGLQELLMLAKQYRLAFMCSECVHWRCHRTILSDTLKAKGHEIIHIMSDNKNTYHQLRSFAQVVNNTVIYPSAQMDMFELMS